ncbi:NME8 [Mytilus edulis]|uniref:NME8 n=1 Tax=Mytilus edulis TaxID=6550 RepID=A0A8S3QKH4_MYTED|nr:NME8 [Mytilus edulis]
MAGRRKAEIQLQMQIESQEEWEDLLSKEGLNVIDVYQEWCGPCTGMVSNFKKIKNEMGDPLLKFCTAKADMIDSLDKYRGHCEPCFLFYAGGCLVAVVRGANSPKILRTITEQLKQEHKCLDGGSERKEIKDPFIAQLESKEKETEKEEEEEEEGRPPSKGVQSQEVVKEVTVALIKPDAVEAGKVDQILEDIKAAGIEILKHEERKLTEDEVRQFYSHLQDQDFFEDLVKFMTSGPSHVLALTKGKTGENIIDEFRDLIGPTDVEEAKTQKPERELAFFFPDFVAPHVDGKAPKLQRTLALVRPEAFRLHKDEIISKIRESGFKVAMQKEMQLTKEMAEEFYKEHTGQEYFDQLVTNMSSGPVLALGLAREDAIEGWRSMLGPKEIEKLKRGPKKDSEDISQNALVLDFFFPMEQTVAVIKPDAEGTKDEIIDRIHEAGFKIAARKETKLTKEIAEEFYADHKDKDYYNDLVEHMTSGPTYLMVLSREGAVDGWRSLIGPTDPTQAKEVSPDSIRATYGKSILENAVHGSSDPDHAKKTIKTIFGDLKFTPDGTALETIDEEAEKDQEDKPVSDSTKDAEESSPEVKQQQLNEQRAKEEETRQETPKEETKEEEKTDEQPSTEEKTEEQPSTEQKTDEQPSTEESKEEQSKEEQQEEKQEEAPKEEKTEEETKAPSPKPSETEAKPSESEAQPQSETEAKPEEQQQEESKTEEKPSEETEQKTEESTAQGEEKKEETQSEEKAPDTQTTEGEVMGCTFWGGDAVTEFLRWGLIETSMDLITKRSEQDFL